MQILELGDFCHRCFVEQVAAGKTQGKKGPNSSPLVHTEAQIHVIPALSPA